MLKRKYEVLETFRFLGAILVALGHFFYGNGITNVIPNSYILVVEYFFVLSAFVIIESQRKSINILNLESYTRKFFEGRTIRLLLPYILLTILYYINLFLN